jgi:hypothetical protein
LLLLQPVMAATAGPPPPPAPTPAVVPVTPARHASASSQQTLKVRLGGRVDRGLACAAGLRQLARSQAGDDFDEAVADLEKRVKKLRKARDEVPRTAPPHGPRGLTRRRPQMVIQLRQEHEAALAAQRAAWEEERKSLQAQIDRRTTTASIAPPGTPKVVTKAKACWRGAGGRRCLAEA